MALFSTLKAIFHRTDAAPPKMNPSFTPGGLTTPDEPDLAPPRHIQEKATTERRTNFLLSSADIHHIDDDVWGLTFAIEYRDSKGLESRRRITLQRLYANDNGIVYVLAHCHERDAPRSFRFDRITSVIDMDGVVHGPLDFFAGELRVTLPTQAIKLSQPSQNYQIEHSRSAANKAGYAQRHAARNGLRLLVALAKSDGMMVPEEIDVILNYIAEKADRAGTVTSEADRSALKGYLQRQRPSSDVLETCLEGLEQESLADQRLFLRSAITLMDADGIHDGAEFDMLLSIQERLNAIS